ncbi:MAG TPA: glycosyltransferase [Saprospiraceae bacterium]|nr:glycosyltransferase [Saprospiraceae bacterium]
MDVVFFTFFRTDNPYSSISLSMAKELAKHHRVFYVNHPYSVKDVVQGLREGDADMRRRIPGFLGGRTQYESLDTIPENFVSVVPPVLLPLNWLPKGRMFRFFRDLQNAVVLRTIRKTLRDHQVRNFLYINCFDMIYAGALPADMGASLRIYHCIDDITDDPYLGKHGMELEHEAMRDADITFVTSTNLFRLMRPHAEHLVKYFNAADVDNFTQVRTRTYPRPQELAGRSGQVIGFIGNLDFKRIDFKLLRQVALAYPDKTLLLIGPITSSGPKDEGLDQLPNVVLAGSRRLHELPPLMQHMDCLLIPFLLNRMTSSIYPLKINEYLAAGKPVVSTNFSEDIRTFADHIYLAADQEDYVRLVGVALAENDPLGQQRRAEVAATNTWEARIRQLWEVVDEHTAPATRASAEMPA